MERVRVTEATAEQLRRFGQTFLGLEIGGTENRSTMIGKLAEAGYTLDFIQLFDPPMQSRSTDLGKPFNVRETDRKINGEPVREVRITIHQQDKPGGDEPVPVGVNGKLMWIPRGEPVWVPEHYVHALALAEEHHYPEYDPDKNGGIGGLDEKEVRRVRSYPFSFA